MIWTGDEKRIKVFSRKQFFKGLGRKNSYLTLPGRNCMDVQMGIDLSILGEDTQITAVERSRTEFSYISRWFLENWPSATPGPILSELCNLTDLVPLDLVFLDYLGNPTHDDAYWIRNHLLTQLLPGARVGITTCKAYRNNHLLAAIRSLLNKHHQEYFWQVQHIVRKAGLPRAYYIHSAMYYILMRCYLFYNRTYEFEPCYYRENKQSTTMMLFNISNIQKGGTEYSEEENVIFSEVDRIVNSNRKGSLLHTVTDLSFNLEGELAMSDSRISEFANRFFEVQRLPEPDRYNKMRGLKRSITVYTRSVENADMVYRHIKRMITQKGGDASLIEAGAFSRKVYTDDRRSFPPITQGEIGRTRGLATPTDWQPKDTETTLTMTTVVEKLFAASTAGEKAAATRLKSRYIDQQVSNGKNRDYLERWVKARLTTLERSLT